MVREVDYSRLEFLCKINTTFQLRVVLCFSRVIKSYTINLSFYCYKKLTMRKET
jgi:hypothetical protein